MSAIHIDFIFGDYKQKQDDKPTKAAQEESVLLVDMEYGMGEPVNGKACDDVQSALACSRKEK